MESKSSPPRHEAADFFMVRTPLLSADHLVTWAVGLEAPALASSDPALPAALVRDRAVVRARLASVVERADVREALFVASPSLEDGLGQWFEDPESDSAQKVERAVVRYLQRMASRPTPFGLCAGVALGSFGASTRLRVGERDMHRRHTRLDLDYLVRLAQAFAEDPALRMQLRVRPNSSLAKVAGRLRYVEGKTTPTGRVYQLVAVKSSAYLLQTLARARDGAPAAALAEALLVDLPEVSAAEAERFIAQLLDAQVLVFDLAPAITGPEPAVAIAEALAAIEGGRGAAQALGSVQRALETLDACPPGQPASQYRAIARTLDALPARAALDRLFQVDLNIGMTAAQLGAQPLRALERGIALLQRITPTSPDPDLARFTERFMQRFEDREVPLALALDEDMGIGFGETPPGAADATPLLEGLAFPHAEKPSSGLLARHTYLLARLADVARAGTQILDLTEHDVRALEVEEARRARIPDSFAAVVVLAAASPDALAADDFQLHLRYTAYGPSGANMLGRYCHLLPALPALLMNYLREEEALRPDAIFAEIVHLPESRIGNVILRPVLRDFEIPYLGRSGAPPDRQISVEDLVVSIERGRIVLRSVQHGREVIPRLATAHNHFDPGNLATYRFLSALQRQDVVPVLTWSWGPLRDTQPFLPRVTAGNLVLSAARWRLLAHQLEPFQRGGATERYLHARMLQAQLALPRLVALEESDNLLPVDLDNPLSVEAFAHLVKARASIVLVELRPDPSELCVDGPGGRFAHELVIPFTRRATPRACPVLSGSRTAPVRRSFPPGSAWLYAKLFTGAGAADDVLREIVTPLVHEVMEAGAVERWFFLRFGDPAWHLRLRLFGEPHRLMSDVLPALQRACEPAFEAGSLWRLQLDTYEREVARYGGDVGIVLAEEVFYADSEAVLSLIHELSADTGARARGMLTLLGMDRLLGDLGFDTAARLALCRDLRAGFAREFLTAEDKVFERSLGARYRTERKELEALLEGRGDPDLIAAADEAFGQRSRQLAPTIAALRAADAAGVLATPLTELAGSFLHLHANRLLRASHRQQELVLADYLCRLYESRLARIR